MFVMMAIEKNNFRVSRFDQEFSVNSRESISSDDDELIQRQVSAVESENEDDGYDEFEDADSGVGSDDFDLFEMGEEGAEFCQIGGSVCSVPVELYRLPGLEDILSVDVWNDVLTEDEKFNLTQYLPDLDQHMFMQTLKELLEGANFHFGSPIKTLFQMLKSGSCEPSVAIYKDCLSNFQKRQHYHRLRKHHNSMVSNLCQMRDAWLNYWGYSIEEKLRVLNIMKSQKSLMYDKMEDDLGSDSLEKDEADDRLWSNKFMDRKNALKVGRNSAYAAGRNSDLSSRVPSVGSQVGRYGQHNRKGILKLAGSNTPSTYYNLDASSKPFRSTVPGSRQNKALGSDSGKSLRVKNQMGVFNDDEEGVEDAMYEMLVRRDQKAVSRSGMNKYSIKAGKKHELMRRVDQDNDGLMGIPFSSKNELDFYGRYQETDDLQMKAFSAKLPKVRNTDDFAQKYKYPKNAQQLKIRDQMKSLKGQGSQPALRNDGLDLGYDEPFWQIKNQSRVSSADSSFRSEDLNVRSKKWRMGRESTDVNLKACRAKSTQFIPNGGSIKAMKANRRYHRSEETESDSSDQFEEEEDINPLIKRRSAFDAGNMEVSQFPLVKTGLDNKKNRFLDKGMQEDEVQYGITNISSKVGGFTDIVTMPEYMSKGKKGNMWESNLVHNSNTRTNEDVTYFGLGKLKDDVGRKHNRSSKNNQFGGESGDRYASASKARKQKTEISHEFIVGEEDEMLEMRILADETRVARLGKRGQRSETNALNRRDILDPSMLASNLATKSRKVKDEELGVGSRGEDDVAITDLQQQINDPISVKKKGKRKLEADKSNLAMEIAEPHVTETRTMDVELEIKPQKKLYTPITPTVHTGFSFSVVHLLSAIRLVMITPLAEDSLGVQKIMEEQNGNCQAGASGAIANENADANKSENTAKVNIPSLTMQEIVDRMRSNPGDPCIFEMQEPLQDIVRGVLKIFSSRTAPLGAKGWKALVAYEKSTKGWSWVGPVSNTSSDHDTVEEVTSPEYWGLPHKTLVKLVDSFANWFKSGQETLQQIGSLPAPPLSLMQCNLDEKERFRDLRAQKSLNTISPSSQEMRAYFRKEEILRYSIPDRAFSYTAADGKKSIVAPLRRCGGKPTSKPRDHFMLKKDRPPHVTILCLVRDAAARLPGSIGTRADVCTLIRDSQYIVEDVSDNQVNQIVSGALDRLHYERDPCVQFDADRKLWVYLHRDREEEDFEDDGTSSTKKWKRQKKDPADQPDQGTVTVAFHGRVDKSGLETGSDLNVDPPVTDGDKSADLAQNKAGQEAEDNFTTNHGSQEGNMNLGDPAMWDNLGLGSMQEHRLPCQQHSTNNNFDDEMHEGERSIGLLSAGL